MQRPKTPSLLSAAHGSRIPRRGMLKFLVSAFGGALAWKSRGTVQMGDMLVAAAPAASADPVPRYLPVGYRLEEIYTGRTDGFGAAADQRAYWYKNPNHPLGYNNPLVVYVARQPKHTSLVPTRRGEPVVLSLPTGESVQAEYHDGLWSRSSAGAPNVARDRQIALPDGSGTLVWETGNPHSISFSAHGLTFGVRGARLAGIDRRELIRVANSVS